MNQKLYVRQDVGSGPPMILIHGMFADGTQWESITTLLSKSFRVIVVDVLGQGRSPRPKAATYSVEEHVNALRNTLASLGITKNITLVGYSMGGSIALAYSATYPNATAQLYLISTPFYLQVEDMIPHRYAGSILMTKASLGLFGLVERIIGQTKLGEAVVRFGNSSKQFKKMIGAYDNKLDAKIIELNLHHLVRNFDFVKYWRQLKVPVTYYAGKKDLFIVQGQLDALRRTQPYADIQRLDIIKIDHMLVQNLPKTMAHLLQKNTEQQLHVGFDKGGGRPIILLHGIESSSDYWQSIVEPLSNDRRVIAIDLLGFGLSPKPLNIAYSIDDHISWLLRTIDALGIKEFELCAHSLGGVIALELASRHPGRITKLTLLAPVVIPEREKSRNIILSRLSAFDALSDGTYLHSQAARVLGYGRMASFLPSLRSIRNTLRSQQPLKNSQTANMPPTTFVYGSRDSLVDGQYVTMLAKNFTHASTKELKGQGHNFALFNPKVVLDILGGTSKKPLVAVLKIPRSFAKQLYLLAAPVLFAKSALYIAAGTLLFSDVAPWVITIGLVAYMLKFGYGYIRGAFSLKYENLSYVGYVILGIGGILAAYGLLKNPDLALRLSSLVICGIVTLAGLARLTVAAIWLKQTSKKNVLILVGTLMTVIGAVAFMGGLIATEIIVYSIAIILIARGVQLASFATTAFLVAYVRGFMR